MLRKEIMRFHGSRAVRIKKCDWNKESLVAFVHFFSDRAVMIMNSTANSALFYLCYSVEYMEKMKATVDKQWITLLKFLPVCCRGGLRAGHES